MQEIFLYLQNLWGQLNYAEAIAILLVVITTGFVIGSWVAKLYKRFQLRKLLRDLHPFYTIQEIQHATQYYVETNCQNIAPSKDDEPGRTHAFAAKEKIVPFFLKKAFKSYNDDAQFYIVLADSGMGKTTFLINLYFRYIEQFFGTTYQIKLFPLGFPDIDKEIEKIPDDEKTRTILLLDGFDEDIQAVNNYKTRLENLIQKVVRFREVVITCRTQFFPSEEEEPKETGILRFGAEGGERVFHKLYLSPFDGNDIQNYVKKRFTWFQKTKRQTAMQIVMSCPNLMVRPMLLSYIEDLVQRQNAYTSTYVMYAELINRWIEREAYKVPPDRRKLYEEELYLFSRELAVEIYRHREERQGRMLITGKELQVFADKHGIRLNDMEMKSRSLLNRNVRGEYKFSHKSVLEYFLAEETFFNPDFRQELDFEGMAQAEAFFDEMVWEKLTMPFFSRNDLSGEYQVKDGKTRMLTHLPERTISEITYLKLNTWNSSDDVLLFRGLRHLKRLDIRDITSSAIHPLTDWCHLFSIDFSFKQKSFKLIRSPYRTGNLTQDLEQGKTDMFYGRQETIQRLKQILIYDDNGLVILYGQRKTGKSCLLKYIEKTRIFEPDVHIVFVNMQKLSSEQDFYDCVLRGMNEIIPIDQETISHVYSFHDFTESFNQLLDMTQKRILFMIDEFESITSEHFKYTNLTNANEFIQKIRNLIQYSPNAKFALAGADGLKTMINDYNNPLFNAGRTVHIAFLHPKESRQLITEPLTAIVNYREEAIDLIQEATFNHPYYLQCLCQRIVDVLNEGEQTLVTKKKLRRRLKHSKKQSRICSNMSGRSPKKKLILSLL